MQVPLSNSKECSGMVVKDSLNGLLTNLIEHPGNAGHFRTMPLSF